MTKQEFIRWADQGLILLDGATGSNLLQAGMPQNEAAELWILDHPQVVLDLQRGYVGAGSQIVYACTFTANRGSLKKHGLADRVEELNVRLVELSREAVGDQALVAGDLSMSGELLEPFGDMTREELFDIYREQVEALVKGGVDLLGVETMLSLEETLTALDAASSVCDLPMMCTFTVNEKGMTLYGTNVVEAVARLEEHGAAAIGVNCSLGPEQLEEVIRRLKEKASVPVIAKPNAGLPKTDGSGKVFYTMDAQSFAVHMKRLIDVGAGIVGGCCGTTPEYIQNLTRFQSCAE